MNEALKILESNELMRHIILFKLYIESDGTPLTNINGIYKPIKELYGDSFNESEYLRSRKYLHIKGYTNRSAHHLTFDGLDYFEGWLKSFEMITIEEADQLNKELPKPIFDFFKFSKETTTVLSFVNQIIKLAERL